MPLTRLTSAAATALFCLTMPLAAQEQPDLDQVVATVNGVEITVGHVAAAKATLPDQYRNLPANVLFPGIVDQLVRQSALAQTYEGDWPKRITLALDNETRSLVAGEVVESILASAVTEENLQAAYEEQYVTADLGEEYNAAHILVETEEEAQQIKADIEAGADFAETAKEKSTGPSGPRGGDLGWFGQGVMVPAFEAAVLDLEAGQVSDPVQTQFGWHIVKLVDTRVKNAPDLETVRAELEQQIRSDAVEARIEELLETANVDRSMGEEVDPAVLDQIDLSKNP